MSVQKQVYLIDASIYVFRAWFSVPDSMRGENNQPVNAAYGFTRFLTEFVERSQATHVAVAFDESLTHSFRNEIYPNYKMNRELPPAELSVQFRLCRKIAESAGLYCVASDTYEADDLIATLAVKMRAQGFTVIIVSGDKDLTQVLRNQDQLWDFARNQTLDSAAVKDKFGVSPEQIPDYLGLCGDAVDNIPGVSGVGPKTAAALLQACGSLEQVYAQLDSIASLNIRGAKSLPAKLTAHRQEALLSKQLATVANDAPIEADEAHLRRRSADQRGMSDASICMGGRANGLFQRLNASARAAQIMLNG